MITRTLREGALPIEHMGGALARAGLRIGVVVMVTAASHCQLILQPRSWLGGTIRVDQSLEPIILLGTCAEGSRPTTIAGSAARGSRVSTGATTP